MCFKCQQIMFYPFLFLMLLWKKGDTRLRAYVFNFNKNVALTSLPVDFDPEVLYMFWFNFLNCVLQRLLLHFHGDTWRENQHDTESHVIQTTSNAMGTVLKNNFSRAFLAIFMEIQYLTFDFFKLYVVPPMYTNIKMLYLKSAQTAMVAWYKRALSTVEVMKEKYFM